MSIDYRWAEYQNYRLPALAVQLVRRKVDVIAAGGTSKAAGFAVVLRLLARADEVIE